MGTHPNGPATLFETQGGEEESLQQYLARHPEAIGVVPAGSRAEDLPFMFKVLSIRTALSIQVSD
jgi:mannose-6-phosphate isomerase class I